MKEQEENEDERNSFLQAFVIYPERNEDIWETLEQDEVNISKQRPDFIYYNQQCTINFIKYISQQSLCVM